MKPTEFGVDFASVDHNPPRDYAALRAAGYSFVGLRACHGATVDPLFGTDAPLARAAGLVVLPYGIVEWGTAPSAFAAALANGIGKRVPGDLPPCVDVEFDGSLAARGIPPPAALGIVVDSVRLAATVVGPTIAVYTSQQQWSDNLGDLYSPALGRCPLWLMTPYYWRAGNPPHTADDPRLGKLGTIPEPWVTTKTPGAFIQQFQGDARGVPGVGQADVDAFLPLGLGDHGPRAAWLQERLVVAGGTSALTVDGAFGPITRSALLAYQHNHGLTTTGVLDLRTFAALVG